MPGGGIFGGWGVGAGAGGRMLKFLEDQPPPPGCQAHLLGEWGGVENEAEIEAWGVGGGADVKRAYLENEAEIETAGVPGGKIFGGWGVGAGAGGRMFNCLEDQPPPDAKRTFFFFKIFALFVFLSFSSFCSFRLFLLALFVCLPFSCFCSFRRGGARP